MNDRYPELTSAPASRFSRRSFLQRAGTVGLAAGMAGAFAAPPASEAATADVRMAADSNSLELWTFVDTHARWFARRADEYKQRVNHNFNLTVRQYPYAPYQQKLLTVLQTGVAAPDLADVEQGMFGAFLHGTVPFVPLESRLKAGGFTDKLVSSREALYTWQGHIYGIEHALCPVVLYYRQDLFLKYGIKPSDLATWDDVIAAGKLLQKHGIYVLPISLDYFEVLLRQRGSDVVDAQGKLVADSPIAVDTLQWLMDLQSKHKVGKVMAGFSEYAPQFYAELQKGTYASLIGADWYSGFLVDNAAKLAGKWRAMPLPVWADDTTKRRTSCIGGTGLCMTISTNKQDLAWDFARFSLLSVAGTVEAFQMIGLYPPFAPAWTDKSLHQAVSYFGGQDLGGVFASVGKEVPAEYQSPDRATYENFASADSPTLLQGKVSPAAFLKKEAARVRSQTGH